MKQKLIMILFLNCLLVCVYSQQYKHITAKELNIRKGASNNYGIIGKLNNADSVYVISETNGWAKIRLNSGRYGFVSSTYLSSKESLDAKTQNIGAEIGKMKRNHNIVMIIVGVIASLIFLKLPEEQRKTIMRVFVVIISICLFIVTLGIFRGIDTWNNDR
ncbi:MAG: SH3 domain-containing protein [Candidatus Azobacteroides sp.]|nr:SH3 domain-containing protein [Candidatus Azobacteroides sp.]